MDFGLAKQFAKTRPSGATATATIAGPALTETGTAIGTPDYMSPEQVRGEPLDQRSDLVFVWHSAVRPAGKSASVPSRFDDAETLAAILRDPPNLSGDLPQGLMLLIRRLLAKSRDERYPSMADVRADLGRLTAYALAPEPQKRDGKAASP